MFWFHSSYSISIQWKTNKWTKKHISLCSHLKCHISRCSMNMFWTYCDNVFKKKIRHWFAELSYYRHFCAIQLLSAIKQKNLNVILFVSCSILNWMVFYLNLPGWRGLSTERFHFNPLNHGNSTSCILTRLSSMSKSLDTLPIQYLVSAHWISVLPTLADITNTFSILSFYSCIMNFHPECF